MSIKKGDFIELDYTGMIAEDGTIFDTTIESDAKRAGLYHEHTHDEHEHHDHHHHEYKPIVICVGERHLLPGLDAKLEGASAGKHSIQLSEDEAFGKKNSKLLKMMPLTAFTKQRINPFPSLELNIDNQVGTIRSVSGGRVIVDFNHPLSGKAVKYDVTIKRKVDDPKEKIRAIISLAGLSEEKIDVEGTAAKVALKNELPEQFAGIFVADLERLTGLKIELAKRQKAADAPKETKKQESEESHNKL